LRDEHEARLSEPAVSADLFEVLIWFDRQLVRPREVQGPMIILVARVVRGGRPPSS
jgi:hypothetical protein